MIIIYNPIVDTRLPYYYSTVKLEEGPHSRLHLLVFVSMCCFTNHKQTFISRDSDRLLVAGAAFICYEAYIYQITKIDHGL